MAMNDELNVVFYDESIAERLEDIFKEDIAHATRITAEQLKERGWLGRFLGLLTSPVRDYF
jgi:phosphatidylserine/phosphatidylglycerophosphate/cardiolipin synthase-like enzyme